MTATLELLSAQPFLAGLPQVALERLAHEAKRSVLNVGDRLFREATPAERFWLLRDGEVALDFHVQGRGDVVIEQLGPGSVVGWSWLYPPYRWHFGAVAVRQSLAIEFNGTAVRRLCGEDPALGYELTQRFGAVLVDRLQAARMRLVDLYGYPA